MSSTNGPVIGIDLGTIATVIADLNGYRTTDSYVIFTNLCTFIGREARGLASLNRPRLPANTFFAALRLIGRKFEDPFVQDFVKHLPFKVISDDDGRPKFSVEVNGERKSFFPEEICSMLLAEMKRIVEYHLHWEQLVTDAVVTVPADFNESQCLAIEKAATLAKLKVLQIIPAPTAFANGHYLLVTPIRGPQRQNWLLFDLGGGTLDVCILTVTSNIEGDCVVDNCQSMAGNNQLGGEDFVNRMLTHFVDEFRRKYDRDITTSKVALLRLRNACEKAKETLSGTSEANIDLFELYDEIIFHEYISRSRFEEINADLFDKVLEPVEKCLRDADKGKSEIHEVILVGGSTRIPKIRQLLQQFFDGKELKTIENSEEVVAYGAAVYAGLINNRCKKPRTKIDGAKGGEQRKAKEQLPSHRYRLVSASTEPTIEKMDQPEPLDNVSPDSIAIITKKILQEEIATDFAIVCESGADIKCHKVFLCAQSEVLRAMIESSGSEAAATNKLVMADMREASVKAFLAFLYHRDTTEASKDSGIAFELLRAAHQYDIKLLEIAMKEMIVTKEVSWFGVGDAVRLFALARHLENGEGLKLKALGVLKKNIATLEKSDSYQELFTKDLESAMDLFNCCVSK